MSSCKQPIAAPSNFSDLSELSSLSLWPVRDMGSLGKNMSNVIASSATYFPRTAMDPVSDPNGSAFQTVLKPLSAFQRSHNKRIIQSAMNKFRADERRDAGCGHVGHTWGSWAYLPSTALEVESKSIRRVGAERAAQAATEQRIVSTKEALQRLEATNLQLHPGTALELETKSTRRVEAERAQAAAEQRIASKKEALQRLEAAKLQLQEMHNACDQAAAHRILAMHKLQKACDRAEIAGIDTNTINSGRLQLSKDSRVNVDLRPEFVLAFQAWEKRAVGGENSSMQVNSAADVGQPSWIRLGLEKRSKGAASDSRILEERKHVQQDLLTAARRASHAWKDDVRCSHKTYQIASDDSQQRLRDADTALDLAWKSGDHKEMLWACDNAEAAGVKTGKIAAVRQLAVKIKSATGRLGHGSTRELLDACEEGATTTPRAKWVQTGRFQARKVQSALSRLLEAEKKKDPEELQTACDFAEQAGVDERWINAAKTKINLFKKVKAQLEAAEFCGNPRLMERACDEAEVVGVKQEWINSVRKRLAFLREQLPKQQ